MSSALPEFEEILTDKKKNREYWDACIRAIIGEMRMYKSLVDAYPVESAWRLMYEGLLSGSRDSFRREWKNRREYRFLEEPQ